MIFLYLFIILMEAMPGSASGEDNASSGVGRPEVGGKLASGKQIARLSLD